MTPPRRPRGAARWPARLGPWLAARALVLLVLAALLAPPAAALDDAGAPAAQPGLASPAAPAVGALDVARNEATAVFPDGIVFALTATAPFPVERIELLYRPSGDETRRLAVPALPVTTAAAVEVEHEVDLRAGDLPPGIDLRYSWRLIGAGGEAAETGEAEVLWRDDRFGWEEVAGERASVRVYAGGEGFGRRILEVTEREIARLEALYGSRLEAPVGVWVYASTEDLAGALRPNSEAWVAGAAYPRYGLILGVIGAGDEAEIGRVIPHEVSHLVLDRATANPFSEPPAWLGEGLAVLQEEGADGPYLAMVREAALAGELDPLRVLGGVFPYDQEGAQLAYAQSLSVVSYILDRYGEAGLARLIAAFREPVTVDEAVRRGLGIPLDRLDGEWRLALAEEAGAFDAAGRSGEGPGLGVEEALAIASGGLVMGLVAVLAVVVGVVAVRRARRSAFDEEGDEEGEGAHPSDVTPSPSSSSS